ncbi:MAG: hypothetical protein AAFZ38_04840, partial [Myxococcota bacterium]
MTTDLYDDDDDGGIANSQTITIRNQPPTSVFVFEIPEDAMMQLEEWTERLQGASRLRDGYELEQRKRNYENGASGYSEEILLVIFGSIASEFIKEVFGWIKQRCTRPAMADTPSELENLARNAAREHFGLHSSHIEEVVETEEPGVFRFRTPGHEYRVTITDDGILTSVETSPATASNAPLSVASGNDGLPLARAFERRIEATPSERRRQALIEIVANHATRTVPREGGTHEYFFADGSSLFSTPG